MSCSCEGSDGAPNRHPQAPSPKPKPKPKPSPNPNPNPSLNPNPSQVTTALHEESPTVLVREIVVKPVPFITVAVRQEFELREVDGGLRLCRAEYIKQ